MELDELVTYLDRKFANIDRRFDETSLELIGVESGLQADIRRLDGRIDGIYEHIGGLADRVDTYHQEMTMLIGQVDRHKRWHHEVADRIGMRLEN